MKGNRFLLLIFGVIVALSSCTKKGDIGVTGAVGPTGPTGPQGPTGPASGPVASAWIVVDSSMWSHTAADSSNYPNDYPNVATGLRSPCQDTAIIFHASVAFPMLTQKILDSGVVYFYFKDSTAGTVRIVNFGPNAVAAVGVTTNKSFQYVINTQPTLTRDALAMSLRWDGTADLNNPNSMDYDPTFPNHSNLPPRTKFYVRCLVIQGGATGGRTAGPASKSYHDVMSYYHIQD